MGCTTSIMKGIKTNMAYNRHPRSAVPLPTDLCKLHELSPHIIGTAEATDATVTAATRFVSLSGNTVSSSLTIDDGRALDNNNVIENIFLGPRISQFGRLAISVSERSISPSPVEDLALPVEPADSACSVTSTRFGLTAEALQNATENLDENAQDALDDVDQLFGLGPLQAIGVSLELEISSGEDEPYELN